MEQHRDWEPTHETLPCNWFFRQKAQQATVSTGRDVRATPGLAEHVSSHQAGSIPRRKDDRLAAYWNGRTFKGVGVVYAVDVNILAKGRTRLQISPNVWNILLLEAY